MNDNNAEQCVTCLSTKKPFFRFAYIIDLLEKSKSARWSNMIPNGSICRFENIHGYSMAYPELTDNVDKKPNTLCAVSCIPWMDNIPGSYQL